MTAPLVFGRLHVLPVVSAFLSRFPDIAVRLVLTDRPWTSWTITWTSRSASRTCRTAT